MKKIIILLLALLMSMFSAVKPAETMSSMQTEPSENLKELFPEEYGEVDSFEEEETEQA